MTKKILMLLFAAVLALATARHAFAQGPSNNQEQGDHKNILSAQVITMLAPQQCFSSGSGVTFLKICITNNGNISWFESPAGAVQLYTREGYAVCSLSNNLTTIHGFDANVAANGSGVSTVSQPGGVGTFPLIVTRQSLDGVIQLKQTFTRNAGERGIDVQMDITNMSPYSSYLRVSRYFDADLNGTTINAFWFSDVSVWGWGALNQRGLMLTAARSSSNIYYPWVSSYNDWNPNGAVHQYARGCSDGGWAVQGDNVGAWLQCWGQ